MEKYMCYGALGVAAVMFLLFLLDLVVQFPFGGGPFLLTDIFGLIASAVVAYLGFNASLDPPYGDASRTTASTSPSAV